MGPVLEVGDRFIRQVYILTICLTIVVAAVLLGFKRSALPSFLIGSAISLSLFLVNRICGPTIYPTWENETYKVFTRFHCAR